MYKHILISTDGSDVAQNGLNHGLSLARHLGAKVTIVTVTEPFPAYASVASGGWVPVPIDLTDFELDQQNFAQAVLSRAQEDATKQGVSATILHLPNAHPATAIIATAKQQDCDLIVMGSHGRRGLGRLLLGSQTAEVLAHSPVPVLVVR